MPESEGIPHTVAQARALAERLRELVDSKEAEARRDRRAPAGVHARRRLRGGASPLRPRALRGRRPRILVPAAGRRPPAPPGLRRQPPRRRDAPGRARLPRRRGFARRPVAAARGGRARGRTCGRSSSSPSGTRMASSPPSLSWLGKVPEEDAATPSPLLRAAASAARRIGSPAVGRPGRADDERLRLRHLAPRVGPSLRAAWRTCGS